MDPLLGVHTTEPGIIAGLESAGQGLKEKFYSKNKTIWKISPDAPQPAGYGRCMDDQNSRFCYTIIRNAGHETPMFMAASAYDMTSRFISGQPFDATWYNKALPKCTAEERQFQADLAGYSIQY